MQRTINVIGENCEVSIHQSSKTVWVASGSLDGVGIFSGLLDSHADVLSTDDFKQVAQMIDYVPF